MFPVCHDVLSVHCSLIVTCWERVSLLALLFVMFSHVFRHFLMLCPGSGVILNCKSRKHHIKGNQEVCPFPATNHKAEMNIQDSMTDTKHFRLHNILMIDLK